MNITQFISFILFQIIVTFLSINLAKNLELKKDIIKSKELKIKLRSLDDITNKEDETEDESDKNESLEKPPSKSSSKSLNSTISSFMRNNYGIIPFSKKGHNKLSTGVICIISIPCIAALLGVATAAAFVKGGSMTSTPAICELTTSPPPPNFIDTSLDKFKVI